MMKKDFDLSFRNVVDGKRSSCCIPITPAAENGLPATIFPISAGTQWRQLSDVSP